MKHLLSLILACLFTAVSLTAETHVLYVDANGSDTNPGTASAPVATLTEALSLAETLQPTESMPVLIKLGQGEFSAPETDWSLACTHVYFSGNGINNTKIIANTITIRPDSITGFKDISLDAVMDIGDTFLPVQQVKVMSLKKATGQLDGVWYDAAGRLTVSEYEKKSDTQTPFGENGIEQLPEEGSSMPGGGPMFVIPDEDATNTFVLKTGDTMTGALELNRIELVSALTNGYMMTGCSIAACNGFYSTNGNSSGGALVYQNVSNMFLYRYPPGGKSPTYWQIYSIVGSASFYSRYIDYGYTPPVATWSDGTLSTAVSTNKPSIDFGTGAAINLQDGTAASDAATVGQLNSVSNTLKGYVDTAVEEANQQCENMFKGFDYDEKYVYVDKYYFGTNGYNGSMQAPYTNFAHAMAELGAAAFFGHTTPVVYIVGNGFYSFPPNNPSGENRRLRLGLIGRGAFYNNIHNDLSGNGSTVFSELGTYIDSVYSARQDTNNSANAILYLKDLVISNVYLYSTAHDDVYTDNVLFLAETQNGQQNYHGIYYVGKLNYGSNITTIVRDSIRPSYFDAIQQSNDAAYVSTAGDTMSNLTVIGSVTAGNVILSDSQNWFVGTTETPGYIVIDNTNSAITTLETSHAPIRLRTHNHQPVIIDNGRLHIGPTLHPVEDEGGEIQLAADPDVGLRVTIDVINDKLRFYAVNENNGDIRMYPLWNLDGSNSLGQAVWTNDQWEVASDFVPTTSNVFFYSNYTLITNLQARVDQLESAVEELQNP